MPRLQVYLPEDLFEQLKARKLPASELLQRALRAEIERLDLHAATDRYLQELAATAGEPPQAERERADVLARRLARRPGRR